MSFITKLKESGWHLTASGIEDCRGENENVNKVIEIAKDTDLKDIGERWLPQDVNKGKCEYVQGPGVLQIQKIRNVSAPKDNEESNYAPRMLKLVLTDGQATCNALEMEKLERIGLETLPGSKMCLKGKVEVEHGFLKLYNRNVNFIGGRVDKIAENWELKKRLSKQVRVYVGSEGGPPPFTPFGQKVRVSKPTSVRKETQNFKSLEVPTKEKKSEDDEFEQQRKATIAEALQAKEEGKPINFGGQKQMGQDKDIARIVEMGFSASQANQALKQSNGDVAQAINDLLSGNRRPGGDYSGRRDRGGDRGGDGRQDRVDIPSREDRRERGGRSYKGRDNTENEESDKQSRPSGPATLFDFLETKIKPEKEEREKSRSYQPLQSFNSSNRSDDNRGYNNRREPPTKYQDPPPRSGRNDNRANGRRSDYGENDRSEWDSKPNYNSDRPSRNNDRGKSYNDRSEWDSKQNYNSDRSSRNNDRGKSYNDRSEWDSKQNYNSDRASRNNDRGKSYNDSKKGQGFTGDRDQYDNDGRRDRGQQRSSYKGGSNEKGNWENKQDRGGNSDRYNESGNRPKSGYQDRKQGRQQDYDQNRPRSEMSGRSAKPDISNQNARNPPPSKDSYSSGNQFSQPPPSLPQYNPGVPPPPLPQQMNNFVPNQGVNVNNTAWKRGDRCMAKYWEDNKYYSAVVENVDPRYPTVVVHFVDYGNAEEVNLCDVRPDPQFLISTGNQGPASLPQQQYPRSSEDTQIRSMEFRRKRTDQGDRQQTFYQPPNRQPLY